MDRRIHCVRCGQSATAARTSNSGMCRPCKRAHRTEGSRAVAEVTKAIVRGDLKRASHHVCADCGTQARDWDHRDYTRPLDVVPVCRSCNLKRGPAFDSVYRTAEAGPAAPFVKNVDRRTLRRKQPAKAG